MYLAYYGLKREPFHTTPDPSFLYLSPSHKEALGAIIYGIEKRKGFIAILGEVGVGKTSILRAYLEQKVAQKQKTVYLFNPVLSFHDLLLAIFRGLEIVPTEGGIPELVNQLHEVLVAEYQAGGTVVLAIDEAQNMPVETLENLRMLSNLETSTDKLIQIILLGQPELSGLLGQPALRQFQQRIALWATICPLTEEESRVFIEHRIARACTIGAPLLFAKNEVAPVLFTKSALALIAKQAEGIPRRINVLCDNVLITGFGRQCKPVPVSVVREIIGDVNSRDMADSQPKYRWAVAIGVAIFFLLLTIFFFFDPSTPNRKVDMQSTINHVDGHTPGLSADSNAESVTDTEQIALTPRTGFPSEKTIRLENNRDKKSSGFQQEQSRASSGGQASAGVPGMAQGDSSGDKEMVSLQKKNSSELNDDSVEIISVQEVKDSILARVGIVRKNGKEGRAVLSNQESTFIPAINSQDTRIVREGESLSQITIEAYGSPGLEYLEWVKENNPQIVNPDFILPGQNIVLPEYEKMKIRYRNE